MAHPPGVLSPSLASHGIYQKESHSLCLVSFPALGNAAVSEMKHQLLFALKDFQVGQTAFHQEQALRCAIWGNWRCVPARMGFPLCR